MFRSRTNAAVLLTMAILIGTLVRPASAQAWGPPPHVVLQPSAMSSLSNMAEVPAHTAMEPWMVGETIDGSHRGAMAEMPSTAKPSMGTVWPSTPIGSSGSSVSTPHPAAHGHAFHAEHLRGPGVENDPGARGPGRIGLGTHWVKDRTRARPLIPGASVMPVWKSPYSYGYFGAGERRHWTRQTGYRDRSLQWTLR